MAKIAESLVIDIRATLEKLASDMNSASRVLAGYEKKFSSIGRGLGTALNVGLGFGIAAGIKKVTSAAFELANIGDRISDAREQFVRFGGTAAHIDAATKATTGLVTEIGLLDSANRLMSAGFPLTAENFALITQLGTQLSETFGGTATVAIEKLTKALTTGATRGIKEFGIYLEKGESLTSVLEKLRAKSAELGPVQESVANSAASVSVQWENLKARLGEVINENATFRGELDSLAKQLSQVDVDAFAAAIGGVARAAISAASAVTGFVSAISGIAATTALSVNALERYVELIEQGKTAEESMAQVRRESREIIIDADKQLDKYGKTQTKVNAEVDKGAYVLGGLSKEAEEAAKANDKLTKAIEGANKKLEDLRQNRIDKAISSGFQDAINNLNEADFKKYTDILIRATEVAFSKSDESKLLSPAKAQEYLNILKKNALDPFIEDWEKQQKKVAELNADQMKESFEASVEFFDGIFREVITTGTIDFKAMLIEVAISFASTLAAALTRISFTPQGIGSAIAQSILGGDVGGIGTATLGAAGIAGIGAGAVGTYGAGFAAGVTGTTTVASSAAGVAGVQAGAAVATAIPYVAAAVAVFAAAEHFGVFDNKKHPDTQARKDVVNFLEDRLGTNIIAGSDSRFNDGKGFEDLDALDSKSRSVFAGVGGALNALLGITEDTGGQIGAILASNFATLDDLKPIIQSLGISLEEFQQSIISTGLQSGATALEIQSDLNAITEAMTPGRAAVGDYAGAIQAFAESGGQAAKAITALRDSAIEAQQAGITSLGEFRQRLEAEGLLTAEQIQQIFQSLETHGITSLDQLANASDSSLISIVALIQSLGFAFQELVEDIKEASSEMDKFNGSTPSISSPSSTNGFNNAMGNAFFHGKVSRFAKGGIISKPNLFNMGLMGEAGPEAIMPLTRHNGRLGVDASGMGGQAMVINIDARGAAPGVEYQIERALREMKQDIVDEAVSAVYRQKQLGGGFDANF